MHLYCNYFSFYVICAIQGVTACRLRTLREETHTIVQYLKNLLMQAKKAVGKRAFFFHVTTKLSVIKQKSCFCLFPFLNKTSQSKQNKKKK